MSPVTPGQPPYRIGHGYDLHRLEPGARPLVIGGVTFNHDRGPISHSDGDALLHAITDAILGALGDPDIGQLFPDNHPDNKDRDSADFLAEALRRMAGKGYALASLDATIILERPKFGPRRGEVIAHLAQLLGVPPSIINVKAKTHEGVDAVGEGRAIETHAVALLTLV